MHYVLWFGGLLSSHLFKPHIMPTYILKEQYEHMQNFISIHIFYKLLTDVP